MNELIPPVMLASYIVLWLIVVVLVITVIAQLHYMGVLFNALDPLLKFKSPNAKLQRGQQLPSATLVDELGGLWNVSNDNQPRVLLFVSSACKSCKQLLDDLIPVLVNDRLRDLIRPLTVVVLGDRERARALRAGHAIPSEITVVADPGDYSIDRWGIARTPTAIPIDEQSRVLSIIESPTVASVLEVMGVASPDLQEPRMVAVGTAFRRKEAIVHDS